MRSIRLARPAWGKIKALSWLLACCWISAPASAQPFLEAAQQDVAILTAPAMSGRGYEAEGHLKAAAYIRGQYEAIGLAAPPGGYYQAFPLAVDVLTEAPRLSVNGTALRLGHAFLPYPSTASGEAGHLTGVVAGGAGLVVREQGRDDYQGKPVDGALVVLSKDVPDSIRAALAASYWSEEARLEAATRRGARAVVFLVDRLTYGGALSYNARIPVLQVRRADWPEQVDSVSFAVHSIQDKPFISNNVVGVLAGTAVPDSVILLTAHYDHLGALGEGVYFPGANDNASGVALLLSLARYFEAHPLRYTLVFIAFSGEEKGLLGSRYFVEHPLIDLRKTRFLLNFDMVASGEDGIVAVGGADFEREYALLEAVNDSLHIGPLRKRQNAPNSDQFFFLDQGLRGFYLYTNRGRQPYHHVDDVAATLEWDDFAGVYELARRFLVRLTETGATP